MFNLCKYATFLAFWLVAGYSYAATWHLSPGGADSGNCTISAPCKSIQWVHDNKAAANDTLLMTSGTYGIANQVCTTKALKIFGGYNNSYAQRNTAGNPTILDASTTFRYFCPNTGQTNWNEYDGLTFVGAGDVDAGGTVHSYSSGALIRMNDVIFKGNTQNQGGAIEINVSGDQLEITNSSFIGNSADSGRGGAILMKAGTRLSVSRSTFTNNTALVGGGGGAQYPGSGGAIAVYGGTVSNQPSVVNINDVSFSGNRASDLGGAVYLNGSYNSLGGEYFDVNISNTTFTNNTSDFGAGVFSWQSSVGNNNVSITNSTFFQNMAIAGYGGAIGCVNGTQMVIDHTTIVNNSANNSQGGGVYTRNAGTSCVIKNSIIAGNTSSDGNNIRTVDAGTTSASQNNIIGFANNAGWSGGSISGSSSTPTVALNQIVSTTISNNGGFTDTLILPSGSPGISGVSSCALSEDQRGRPRISGANCDQGAIEYNANDSLADKGPGGVGSISGNSSLTLWLDGNTGLLGSKWVDRSGSNHIFQSASASSINDNWITQGLLNDNRVAIIDGDEQFINLSADINVRSLFLVYKDSSGDQDWTTPIGTGHGFLHGDNDGDILSSEYGQDELRNGNSFANGQPINGLTYDKPSNYEIFSHVLTSNFTGVESWYIGSDVCACGDRSINGGIAEIIMFSDVNAAKRIIIENYLSAKYGLSLNANDKYTGDNNGYDFDVAGIGQATDGSNHLSAKGAGIVRINNPQGLANNEFFMWGHNRGALEYTTNDVANPVESRLSRVWAYNNSGISTVNMTFDVSGIDVVDPNKVALLIDNNAVFATGANFVSGSFDAATQTLTFSNVAITGNGYFTLAYLSVIDTDGDGIQDGDDNCPNDPDTSNVNTDGDAQCNTNDPDDDNDGIADAIDANNLTPIGSCLDTDSDGAPNDDCGGHPIIDNDDDNDGVLDGVDNCPLISNSGQANTDGDLFGDVCDNDADNDGLDDLDGSDPYPGVNLADIGLGDYDGDGRPDACPGSICTSNGIALDPDHDEDGLANGIDNCPFGNGINGDNSDDANTDQTNTDEFLTGGDGLGDLCDDDDDADGIADNSDNCSLISNTNQANIDADAQGNVCDDDDDNDSISDLQDNCPLVSNSDQLDRNGNGLGDVCEVVYVDKNAVEGDCESWDEACNTIQAGIDRAIAIGNPNVFIKADVYNVSDAIVLKSNTVNQYGISLYGGFLGGETKISEADPESHLTIISGDVASALIEANEEKSGGNTGRLMTANIGDTSDTYKLIVSGLIFNAAGNTNSSTSGAGLYIVNSNVELLNVQFVANEGADGAAVRADDAKLTILNSTFENNISFNFGIIYADNDSEVTITNTLFNGNTANEAGAILVNNSELNISASTFSENSAVSGDGGAIKAINDTLINVDRSFFDGNVSAIDGGAISLAATERNSKIDASTFTANIAANKGGAVVIQNDQGLLLINSSFKSNSANVGGALGIYGSGQVNVVHASIASNSSDTQGGGIYLANNSLLSLKNSIVAGNSAGSGSNIYLDSPIIDAGYNLFGFNEDSGVIGSGFNLVTNTNSPSYTGSFTAVTSSINNIIKTNVSKARGDDGPTALIPMLTIPSNSLARDIIPASACRTVITDQSGANRPDAFSGFCDVGAHEFTELTCQDKRDAYQENDQFSFSNCGAEREFIIGETSKHMLLFMLLLSLSSLKRRKADAV